MLRVLLFGAPRIELEGQFIPLRRTKALALLAYTLMTRQPQDREILLGLLWPEFDDASARNNLRRELSLLKASVPEELLIADRLQVRRNNDADCWLDVAAFQAQLAVVEQHGHRDALCPSCATALSEAVKLYGDDFLAGFSLPDSPAFDEWQFFQREELRQQLAAALQSLIGWHRAAGAYPAALESARRWLQLEPLHEAAQREVMQLYAWTGMATAAMRQYHEYVRVLSEELGAEPEPETTELYEAIKGRRAGVPIAAPPVSPQAQPRKQPMLPAPVAGFVGRQRELNDIVRRLTDPACRLLTLTGPGGIGKTQLALQAAQTLADGWAGDEALADGVLFVAVMTADTTDGLVAAIAAAAQIEFYPSATPQQQLFDYLRDKRMLLVLDNFEQLLGEVDFVGNLLSIAPGLRLLITSRVALNLREEWFHPVEGLSFPAEDHTELSVAELARYDAMRLFEQHARRIRSDFSFSSDRAAVARLCQLVAGMPLALELAASWLKLLSVERIVTDLEGGLDILTTRERNIPERHRRMRPVLEESWQLLSPIEQQALAALTIFRGSFSAEAAEQVGGVSLATLAALVEQSLLRRIKDERFQLHELIRQFAAERLAADEPLAARIAAQHSAYYLEFLAEREERLRERARGAALAEIDREVTNLHAAWQWAIAHGDADRIDQALLSTFGYYAARHDYQAGANAFDEAMALQATAGPPLARQRVLCRVRIRRGAFYVALGDYDTAAGELDAGVALARDHDLQADVGFASLMLGIVARWQGDAHRARHCLEEALDLGMAIGDQVLVAQALHELASIAGSCGDYAECERLAGESLALSRTVGRDDLILETMATIGWSASCRGDYCAAEAIFGEGLELAERSGNDLGISRSASGIGWVAWCAGGRLAEARTQIERSLAIERRRGAQLWIANFLGDLGMIALDSGEAPLAELYAREALQISRTLDSAIYTTYSLGILGRAVAARQEFTASLQHLDEALRTSSEAQLWSQVALTLYQAAVVLSDRADTLDGNDPAAGQLREHAVELLASIVDQPLAWHVCRVRAGRLIDELRRSLPDDRIAMAYAIGQRFDWRADIQPALDKLGALSLLQHEVGHATVLTLTPTPERASPQQRA